jgi:MtrB/PioB family decaheme-associated outer membrane protein
MKICGRIILTGIASVTFGSLACYSAAAQNRAQAAEPEQQMWPAAITDGIATDHGGVKSWGDIEFGGRYFIQRPGDIGRAWLTPGKNPNDQSISKFEEYGKVPEGAFLERLQIGGQTKDAEYFVDLRATDVGNNNQRYIFDWGKTGDISGTVSWDQIPHLYSTTAQNIWKGVGTSNLTTNVNLGVLGQIAAQAGATVPAQVYNNTPIFQIGGVNGYTYNYGGCTQAGNPLGCVGAQDVINQALRNNLNVVKIGIERDKLEADQRWTPSPNWEVRGTYSTERREGTQISGTNWGGGGGAETVQVIRPVGDTTQNGKASAERTGEWGYGKYNVKLTGSISTFDNDFSSFTVQNPYFVSNLGTTAFTGCNATFLSTAAVIPGFGNPGVTPPCSRISLMPSNQAYTANLTSGIDLPFQSRFMNTVQYTAMRQDDPFQPFTVNTGNTYYVNNNIANAVISGNPAFSLSGEVNALLVNNVLNTQVTRDLKSSLRYRYYDNANETPVRTWTWVTEDGAGSGAARRNFGYSYSKHNASEDLTYHVLKNTSVGGGAGWERINRDKRESLQTDEYIGKLFGDTRFDNIGQFRASYQYSERRYDRYDAHAWYSYIFPVNDPTYAGGGGMNNWGERKMDLANRNREKATAIFTFDNIPYVSNLALSPTFGLRNDHYLTDPNKQVVINQYVAAPSPTAGTPTGLTQTTYEMGLLKDNSWNGGIEAAYTFRPGTSLVLAYVHENFDKDLVSTNTGTNTVSGATNANPALITRWGSNMKEDVNTFIVGFNVALNDQFDLSTSYSVAFAQEDWTSYDISGNSACAVAIPAVSPGCAPFPTVNSNLHRVDAILKYRFDSESITKLGFEGDVYWKVKYSWDRARVDNWQNDLANPYMYVVDAATAGRAYQMAGFNPNYDIHAVATSLNLKW